MENTAELVLGKTKQDNPVFYILFSITLTRKCLVAASDIPPWYIPGI